MAQEMVTVSVSIPKTIADKLETILDKHEKPPRKDPKSKATIIEKQFPNGVSDWVREVVGANISGYVGANDPDVQAMNEQIAALQEQMREKFKPSVTVE